MKKHNRSYNSRPSNNSSNRKKQKKSSSIQLPDTPTTPGKQVQDVTSN